ncbi:MAG: tripartite tricarboxylate transporter substrate binding protein [Betaproteobacteria bacterium]|nr:tripartite tricarboxylate transporter substrate binding protein [Betaproteobacteria bacterium]
MRQLLPALVALALLSTATAVYAADSAYPARPVRLIVPYPPGGGSDITGRAIGNKLTEYLGQTFVIDNRPGATGLIGTLIAARAPADGYTIILADAPHTINSLVYTKPPYDAIRDFTPVNLVATSPQALLANPKFNANTLKELLAMPRAQTEKLAIGSSGQASGPHMVYEWLRLKTGLTLNHIPYKGGGPSLADAAAGQIPLVINAVPAAMSHVKAGRLKVLAITSPQRHPLLPDAQTFVEAGVKDFVTFQWYGIFGPAGLPKGTVTTLNHSINKALAAPEVKNRFASLTFDSNVGSPEDFRKLLVAEDQRWKGVLQQVKIRLD